MLIALLTATACTGVPLEHYIMSEPPVATIYINGKKEGTGKVLWTFDFTSASRVWISAVHRDYRAETMSYTESKIRRHITDGQDIVLHLGN